MSESENLKIPLPPLGAEAPPLKVDLRDTLRVGKTRVTLDLVISAYQRGMSAEEIVESFTTLNLADVYLVIGYYLIHRREVDLYLDARKQQADELRKKIEMKHPPQQFREQLEARKVKVH